jgi:hypothetical protein
MPIMIFPPLMDVATKTYLTRTPICPLKSEWPKVLSDGPTTSTNNVFTGMNIDQNNGNIVLCGWSLMATHVGQLYPSNGKKRAINFLLNNLGDVIWHYSYRSIRTVGGDLGFQAIRFGATGDAVLSLL